MRKHLKDRITKEQYEDLYNRRRTVRAIAKELGVTENWLSHAITERAPKPPNTNPKLLRATRLLYQNQVAREVLTGKYSIREAADLAFVSERTLFRRLKALKVQLEDV